MSPSWPVLCARVLCFSFVSLILISYSFLLVRELHFALVSLSLPSRSLLKSPFKPWRLPGSMKTRENLTSEPLRCMSSNIYGNNVYNTLRLYLLPSDCVTRFHITINASFLLIEYIYPSRPSRKNSVIYPDYNHVLMSISVFYLAIFFEMRITHLFQVTQNTSRSLGKIINHDKTNCTCFRASLTSWSPPISSQLTGFNSTIPSRPRYMDGTMWHKASWKSVVVTSGTLSIRRKWNVSLCLSLDNALYFFVAKSWEFVEHYTRKDCKLFSRSPNISVGLFRR